MYRKPITPFRSCLADTNSAALCLAAPAAVQQDGRTTSRNVGAWLSVADFLTLQNLSMVLSARASASGQAERRTAQGAGLSTLPDGNHGEITEVVKA
jgi:hypothetical protein